MASDPNLVLEAAGTNAPWDLKESTKERREREERVLNQLTMEHALLGRGMGAMKVVTTGLRDGAAFPFGAVTSLIRFFRVFGNDYHQGKEEQVILPALEECYNRTGDGPTGQTLDLSWSNHARARELLSRVECSPESPEGQSGREAFVKAAEEYVTFMRNHISAEKDFVLSAVPPMLRRADDSVMRSFEEYAARRSPGGRAEEFALELDRILQSLAICVPPDSRVSFAHGVALS